jgi:hypothetical protein
MTDTQLRNSKARALIQSVTDRNTTKLLRLHSESNRAQLLTLQGIVRWQYREQKKQRLDFHLSGFYPESSVSLCFGINDDGSMSKCFAKLDPAAFRRRAGSNGRLSTLAASYLKTSIGVLLNGFSGTLMSSFDIGPALMTLDWQVGRLEHLATELTALEARKETQFLYASGKTLEIEMSGCLVTIELDAMYPFKSMTVRIDVMEEGKHLDVRGLIRHVVRQAKPGHQYLTRLYECMNAYLTKKV